MLTNVAARVLVADDLHFHWRRSDGRALCGAVGAVMPIDMAVDAGFSQCARCHVMVLPC